MIIEACRCEDGFGVNHNHLVYGHTGRPFPEVQIWVDWKKVARALALDDACPCPCHTVIQPGLVPCPTCEHSSRTVAPEEG